VLRSDVYVQLWASPGVAPEERVPLLVVHDGPEYARYSSLLTMLERHSSAGALPRMRAALLAPVDRNQTYSASAAYARALAHDILPALGQLAPIPHGRGMRVGMGASLGALAMLHAHRLYPAAFGALYLQSGSYFMRRHDVHESSFPRFARITRYVSRVLSADEWSHPIPVALTCGSAEENLTNNRAVESALAHQGYDVTFYENPDAHNWVAWRDAFDPSLVELLKKVWG
jgi:enterochelin esterase family protein